MKHHIHANSVARKVAQKFSTVVGVLSEGIIIIMILYFSGVL